MKITEFLRLVTPGVGVKYAAELYSFSTGGKVVSAFKHYPQNSVPEMAATLLDMDGEGKTVYYALAGFAEPTPAIDKRTGLPKLRKNGQPKMDMRTAKLAIAAKAVWCDLDCDPKKAEVGLGYTNKKEAMVDIIRFCKEAHLSAPVMVDSGGGLHCYWPFTKDVPAATWHKVARMWRQVLVAYGVRSDPSRDMDIASVLRPPHTHNRKTDTPRLVRVINKEPPAPTVVTDFVRSLLTALQEKGERPQPPKADKTPSRMDDLDIPRVSLPSSALELVKHCNQILQFHQRLGDVPEPVWRAALGVLKHTTDGASVAHEWSSGHPEYSAEDTQEKLDRWETGPATCNHFGQINPEWCKNCGHKGKITSPIQLGYAAPDKAKIADVITDVGGVQAVVEGVTLPKRYAQHPEGGVIYMDTDADGVSTPIHFCRVAFYPVARVRTFDGTYAYRFRILKLDGKVRYLDLPSGDTASSTLTETLAAHEVFMTNVNLQKYLRQYVTDFCAQLAQTSEEVRTYDQFGWHDDMSTFVIGERVYCADGSVKQGVLDGNASACQKAFASVKESATAWVAAVDWMYNREDMAQMQYALCSGFGSLLGPFQTDLYAGIPLALTDADSGKGKTTVCKLALSAFGNWRDMTISTKEGATQMARIATLAAHGNLPVLIDEITDIEAEDMAAFLYAVSNGRDRLRLRNTGTLRETQNWNLSAYLTANDNISNKLAAMARDTEGNQVRIFEISTKMYPVPLLDPIEVDRFVTNAQQSAGYVGDRFIRHIVQHHGEITDLLARTKHILRGMCPEMDAPQWRFFRYHAECTLAAAEILKELGLIHFDLDALRMWTATHLRRMVARINDQKILKSGPEDQLDQMLREYQDRIITTYGFRKRTGDVEPVLNQLRGAAVGRYVLGEKSDKTADSMKGKLFIAKKAVHDWCSTNRVDHHTWLDELTGMGIILPLDTRRDRVYLGQGTAQLAGQTRCYCVDMERVRGAVALTLIPPGVTPPVADVDEAVGE